MLNFLAKTENLRNAGSEPPNYNRGKAVKKKQREIAIRNFQILINYLDISPDISPIPIGSRAIANKAETNKKWTRVNPQWKGGQLGYPNGPVPKLNSRVKTNFPCWN